MTNSRDQILARLAANKPQSTPLPEIPSPRAAEAPVDLLEQFSTVAVNIGSSVYRVQSYNEIESILKKQFGAARRVVSRCPELRSFAASATAGNGTPHALESVDLAILPGLLGVAENSAIWLNEEMMGQRVLPFICQHLALILPARALVATMHQAYSLLEDEVSGYGVFIAGPSKTADIEQSLVLGAHGPRSLSVFIL